MNSNEKSLIARLENSISTLKLTTLFFDISSKLESYEILKITITTKYFHATRFNMTAQDLP